MIKRTKYKGPLERWSLDPDKVVTYEFDFKGQIVQPGMKLKLKNDRSSYTFICLVHNVKTGSTWIELSSPEGFKSARVEKVTRIEGIKRSYRKKVAV